MTILDLIKVAEMYTSICIFKHKSHESLFSGTTNTLYELCYRDLRERKILLLKIINNSLIAYFYKVKDMDYEKEIYLSIVNELLNSLSSRLLNKKLRDENDLVYSSYSTTSLLYFIFLLSNNRYLKLSP